MTITDIADEVVGSKDSSGTIIQKEKKAGSEFRMVMRNELSLI